MFSIVTIKGNQSKTHIVKSKLARQTICGRKIKRTQIVAVVEGGMNLCTCGRCITVMNSNPELF